MTQMVEIRCKKNFLIAKAATNSLLRRPLFLPVFKSSSRDVFPRLGTETSPVIGSTLDFLWSKFNGDHMQRNFLKTFSIIGSHSPIIQELSEMSFKLLLRLRLSNFSQKLSRNTTCASILTLPWQSSFESQVFQTKKDLFLFLRTEL